MSEDHKEPTDDELDSRDQATSSADLSEAPAAGAQHLGVQRYVLAGFFAAGIVVAYLASNVLLALWNFLANSPWVASHASILNRVAEDERGTFTLLIGAAIGILTAVRAYRRDAFRTWINDVALELTKVTWPDKKEVTNSTVVVVLTSAFATVFLALLDRFWGFVTNLVYGT